MVASLPFFAAHALLFKLHLPNRYSEHSLRIVLAIAAAITSDCHMQCCGTLASSDYPTSRATTIGISSLDRAALILYPSFEKNFPNTK